MDIIDNVIPFIGGEEEKLEYETGKDHGIIQRWGLIRSIRSSFPHIPTELRWSMRYNLSFVCMTNKASKTT